MAIIGRDPKAQIEFDGSFVMAQNVEGLLSASQYHDLQNASAAVCGSVNTCSGTAVTTSAIAYKTLTVHVRMRQLWTSGQSLQRSKKLLQKQRLDNMRRKFFNRGGGVRKIQ